MRSLVVLMVLLAAGFGFRPDTAHAVDGHENLCQVVNVGYGPGTLTIICASGSINMAVLPTSSEVGSCPSVDIDTLKAFTSQALAARVSGLVLTLWWTDSCGLDGSQTFRAITGIEVKGN